MKKVLFLILTLCVLGTHVQAAKEGWLKVPKVSRDIDIHYQPLSIQIQPDGKRQVSTLLNYRDSNGFLASIVTKRMFDCQKQLKQDLLSLQYDEHWGDGEVINTSGKENDWKEVPPETNSYALLALTCGDTPAISTQLHR